MTASDRVVVVMGAGDYIGSAIAERFARGGYRIVAARRNKTGDKLEPLRVSIESAGRVCHCITTDARKEEQVTELFERTERDIGPIEVCVFNVGGNVRFPIADTTTRVFYKVWEKVCFAGFLTGREAAKYMVPRGYGSTFSPALPQVFAVGAGMQLSRAPNSVYARWPRAWRASWGQRTSTSVIWSSTQGSTPSTCEI